MKNIIIFALNTLLYVVDVNIWREERIFQQPQERTCHGFIFFPQRISRYERNYCLIQIIIIVKLFAL
jgi:hypothetical protein